VAPDLVIDSASALDAAHREALKKILARATDGRDKAMLDWAIAGLDARLNPPTVDVATLSRYAGAYGAREIKLENGALLYRRGQNPWARLIPMSATLFQPDNIDYFRVEVVLDDKGNPTGLVGHYDNGNVDRSERTAK